MKLEAVTKSLVAGAVSVLVAACGGGGDAPPAPVASLELSGTAAIGAALADANVQVKCASGDGTATTSSNGGYTVSISGGALPCIIKVTGKTGGGVDVTLHSLAERGSAGTNGNTNATANVTPVTEMIVAQLAAALPADAFANFNPQQVTQEALAQAATAIVEALKTAGIDLGAIDPMKDALVPATNGGTGNAYDQLLDKLGGQIGPESLPLVVNQIASSASSNSSEGLSTAMTSVAGGALEGCPSALSGKYRVIDYNGALQTVMLDFKAMTVATEGQSGTEAITANSAQACEISVGEVKVMFGPAGVGAISQPGMTGYVIPAQSHPLSAIVGTWNFMESGLDEMNKGTHAIGQFTVNADGTGSACDYDVAAGDFSVCHVDDEKPSVTVNADGGFDLQYGTDASRIFAFRAPNGEFTFFGTNNPGNSWDPTVYRTHFVMSKPRKLELAAVGTTTKTWELQARYASGVLTSEPVKSDSFTVTATDAAASTQTRQRASDGNVDTFQVNYPVDGLRYRASAPGLASVYQMPLPSLSMWVIVDNMPLPHFHGIALARP